MSRYKLFAMRLGLRAVSAAFNFFRVFFIFGFGVSATTTLVVDRAHVLDNVAMSHLWQDNQAIFITSLILALGVDMVLSWLKNQVIFPSPRIINWTNKLSFSKPKIINLNVNEPQN